MSDGHTNKPARLAVKQAVEEAIVIIYDAAYACAVDLTPIDEAVDSIRKTLQIQLVDCDRCGETLLIELARPGRALTQCLCQRCAEEKP